MTWATTCADLIRHARLHFDALTSAIRRAGQLAMIDPGRPPPRTLLEALIRERRQTFEEFAEDTELSARESGEVGTLSARHAQRLASGVRADGRPLGPVRPATRRVLEAMFGIPIEELLGPPRAVTATEDTAELAARLAAARSTDRETVAAFQQRLDLSRQLDRRLGGRALTVELSEQIRQMQELTRYSVDASIRRALAAVIADACALVGWQWLDQNDPMKAWDYYSQGMTAATETGNPALQSYVLAGQSVVLLDLNESSAALRMTEHACNSAGGRLPRILAAWLSAAHGESCAANNLHAESLRSFDRAEQLLSGASSEEAPFLVFGQAHLARWRGNTLMRLRDRRAVDALTQTLSEVPSGFTRAETAVLVDLATALGIAGERDAAESRAARADSLARQIGSIRHRRRIDRLRRVAFSPSAAGAPEGHR